MALSTAELVKKARKAKLLAIQPTKKKQSKIALAKQLFDLAEQAQINGWNAEELLRGEIKKRERELRKKEQAK